MVPCMSSVFQDSEKYSVIQCAFSPSVLLTSICLPLSVSLNILRSSPSPSIRLSYFPFLLPLFSFILLLSLFPPLQLVIIFSPSPPSFLSFLYLPCFCPLLSPFSTPPPPFLLPSLLSLSFPPFPFLSFLPHPSSPHRRRI